MMASPNARRWAGAASVVLHVSMGLSVWAFRSEQAAARGPTAAHSHQERRWQELGEDPGDAVRASRILEVLQAPDAIRVTLTSARPGFPGQGLAWWSPSHGIWFAGDGLPALAAGRMYQIWLVPAMPPPISQGLLGVNARGSGRLLSISAAPMAIPTQGVFMVAITDEPSSGSSTPTSPFLLAGSVTAAGLRR